MFVLRASREIPKTNEASSAYDGSTIVNLKRVRHT